MPTWITALFEPIASIIRKRQDRKLAAQSAKAALMKGQQDNHHTLELNKDEWESLQVKGMDNSWKDEYVTVSVVSIFNLIVLGGILSAFGHDQLLTGVAIAITSLSTAGVDVGFLLEAAVLAGLGLSIWKRF
jgi:hypothetical protein